MFITSLGSCMINNIWGLYGVAKKASGAQCFIMALGLFWDIVTGLP